MANGRSPHRAMGHIGCFGCQLHQGQERAGRQVGAGPDKQAGQIIRHEGHPHCGTSPDCAPLPPGCQASGSAA